MFPLYLRLREHGWLVRRYLALLLASAFTLAAGYAVSSDCRSKAMAVPPWHLWGSQETVPIPLIDPANPAATAFTKQLAKIHYKRPDTWDFLFTAKALNMVAGSAGIIVVNFTITIGIGRASSRLQNFVTLDVPANAAGGDTDVFWSNTALTRGFVSSTGTPSDVAIDQIVAEDIQVEAQINVPPAASRPFVVEVASYFAPRTHVRPDWAVHHFDGDELDGD